VFLFQKDRGISKRAKERKNSNVNLSVQQLFHEENNNHQE